jgi:hypothetical protein
VEDQTRPVGGRVLWRNQMKIVLDVQLIPDFGINIDVQPSDSIAEMTSAEQQAIAEEAIRALEHYIIMVTLPQEVS